MTTKTGYVRSIKGADAPFEEDQSNSLKMQSSEEDDRGY